MQVEEELPGKMAAIEENEVSSHEDVSAFGPISLASFVSIFATSFWWIDGSQRKMLPILVIAVPLIWAAAFVIQPPLQHDLRDGILHERKRWLNYEMALEDVAYVRTFHYRHSDKWIFLTSRSGLTMAVIVNVQSRAFRETLGRELLRRNGQAEISAEARDWLCVTKPGGSK